MGKRPASDNKTASESKNAEISKILLELADFEKNKNGNLFKYNAYRKAASVIAKHDQPIISGKDARKLDGVGAKIAKKIDEFLSTGKLRKLDEVRNDKENQIIQQLTRVTGIGPSHAHKFIKAGITSIADLEKHKDKLTHHQLIGLKHYEDFEKRIPREEMVKIESIISEEIKSIDSLYQTEVVGSYRRGLPSSGDIDFLITHPQYTSTNKVKDLLTKIVKSLIEKKLITDTLAHGDTKFMGVCRLPFVDPQPPTTFRRIDLRLLPIDQYYPALLFSTGSDLFNKRMRNLALEKGFTINEYSIRPLGSTGVPGEPLPVKCEKDIFDYIGMEFVPPEKRSE